MERLKTAVSGILRRLGEQLRACCVDQGPAQQRAKILLVEMEALRAEIRDRIASQDRSLNYIFVIVGATLAAVTASGSVLTTGHCAALPRVVLLIIPILTSSVGFVYLSHEIAICSIGKYLMTEIYPKLRDIGGDDLLVWEDYFHRRERTPARAPSSARFGRPCSSFPVSPSLRGDYQ